jgi:hypothetical protein
MVLEKYQNFAVLVRNVGFTLQRIRYIEAPAPRRNAVFFSLVGVDVTTDASRMTA